MLIHCTKKVCGRLKITPPVADKEYNPLYSWRMNVVEEGRRRLVVFMNAASRYCVALSGIKAKDWPKLPNLFLSRLRDVMLAEQINPDVIDRYFSEAGEIEYYRNSDRQMTAWLNKACVAACSGYSIRENDVDISLHACHYPVGSKDEKDYWEPSDRLLDCLSVYGLPLKRCRAFELDIGLQTHAGFVRRTLIVPAGTTFEQLAEIIRRAYGWYNWKNQFHFLFFSEEGNAELYLREERDPSTFPLPAVVMTGVRLSDYVPRYKIIRFLYDYRAQWELYIKLTDVYDSYIGEVPHLKAGEGNAPPEDVGGEEGYAELLKILENGSYRQRKQIERWGRYHSYKEFNLEDINRVVERALRLF